MGGAWEKGEGPKGNQMVSEGRGRGEIGGKIFAENWKIEKIEKLRKLRKLGEIKKKKYKIKIGIYTGLGKREGESEGGFGDGFLDGEMIGRTTRITGTISRRLYAE